MFYIKEIVIDKTENSVKIFDGLKIFKTNDKYIAYDNFWGNSDISLGDYADCSLIKENSGLYLLPYVNEFSVKNLDNEWKQIDFRVNALETENINGYIVIVKSGSNIETSGSVLFKRRNNRMIAVLKEGDYIQISGKKFEITNNKLCYNSNGGKPTGLPVG